MEHLSTQVEADKSNVRAKVLELSSQGHSQGHSQREITEIIPIDILTIGSRLSRQLCWLCR
jgi:hypothetical protein